ncbi:hypothetical protein EB796_014223 [Bugula neritina]|uniref:Uncharacterized protein n=1 Tax=Bugula neritina TaxID=10212 RepID=A0A7J7JP64_BUGNE|nr:hypothetical protein EB796_014223 [Bugula neritina]
MSALCDKLGPGKLLSGVKDLTDKVIPALAVMCRDPSQQASSGRHVSGPFATGQVGDGMRGRFCFPSANTLSLSRCWPSTRPPLTSERSSR